MSALYHMVKCSSSRKMICGTVTFWRFDEVGAVLYYDSWTPNLPLWFKEYSGLALDANGLVPKVAQEAAIATNLW
jgi:hypothetical protein